jgi:hypothetical protein
MRQKFALSLTASPGDFSYLFQFGIPAPQHMYTPHTKVRTLGDQGVKGYGWPHFEWNWAFVSEDDVAFFRTFCPSTSMYSNDVYAITLNDNNEWISARTMMFWPPPPHNWSGDYILNFSLLFKVVSVATL